MRGCDSKRTKNVELPFKAEVLRLSCKILTLHFSPALRRAAICRSNIAESLIGILSL